MYISVVLDRGGEEEGGVVGDMFLEIHYISLGVPH